MEYANSKSNCTIALTAKGPKMRGIRNIALILSREQSQ